jgi:thioredoxin-dependent peroxiredoxin
MSRPTAGELAPDFTLAATGAPTETITLSELRGKHVVLFFYPKDDTPGCTVEACAFRDLNAAFAEAGVVVLGLSKDGLAAHGKFTGKFGLNFPLLADTETTVAQAYGIWVQKMNYGKPYMGIERTTFVIDEEGRIEHVFAKVKPEGHAEAVLRFVQGK